MSADAFQQERSPDDLTDQAKNFRHGISMGIIPNSQVSLHPYPGGCYIYFARVPSREILNDFIRLQEDHPGITVLQVKSLGDVQLGSTIVHLSAAEEDPSIILMIHCTPVYESTSIAGSIAQHLYKHHGFTSIRISDNHHSFDFDPFEEGDEENYEILKR